MIQNTVVSVWKIDMFDIRKLPFSINTYMDYATFLEIVEEF